MPFLSSASGSRPPFTGVLLGPGPESAPRSAFWAILGTCLGVPQRVLLSAFAFLGPKNAKKHSKSTLWGTPRQVPKIAQKALRGALSGPGPKSTPVNGGRDRKFSIRICGPMAFQKAIVKSVPQQGVKGMAWACNPKLGLPGKDGEQSRSHVCDPMGDWSCILPFSLSKLCHFLLILPPIKTLHTLKILGEFVSGYCKIFM